MVTHAVPLARSVDPRVVDAVVEQVNALHDRSRLEMALAAGEALFTRVFRGDLALLKRRGPRFVGFRMLAAHPALRVSARQLWQAARIYVQSLALPPLLRDHLGFKHHLALLGARDDVRREALARRAVDEGWSTRALERAVAAEHAPRGGGDVPVPPR